MNRESTFVWRVTSADTDDDTVFDMTYTNWGLNQPNNHMGVLESCVGFFSRYDNYRWHDYPCSNTYCSVCELDMTARNS